MNTTLVLQDAATVPTGLLAVFAVDLANAKDAEPRPLLVCTSDAEIPAAQRFDASWSKVGL